jgi:hypothetical protein
MMRHRLAIAAMLLPLAGCVVPPQAPYAYAQAYPQPYPQQAYPAAYGHTDLSYPGYGYIDGSPTIAADGGTWPLIFYGGAWGYWDGYHSWHRAPDQVWHHLESRYPGGAGYRPWNGGGGGTAWHGGSPGGAPPIGAPPGAFHPGPGGVQRVATPPPGRPASTPTHPPSNGHKDDHH